MLFRAAHAPPGGGAHARPLSRAACGPAQLGFNLYYGARGLCGQGKAGWRWIDLRGLARMYGQPYRLLHCANQWGRQSVGRGGSRCVHQGVARR